MLLDLFRHQAWADAEHWRALKAAPEALDDHAIRERLCHLHLVQQAFLWAVRARGDRFTAWKPEDYPDLRAQNATRLRELGGAPPLTDLIVWWWKGRPEPAW